MKNRGSARFCYAMFANSSLTLETGRPIPLWRFLNMRAESPTLRARYNDHAVQEREW